MRFHPYGWAEGPWELKTLSGGDLLISPIESGRSEGEAVFGQVGVAALSPVSEKIKQNTQI
jgi:hypothetical protein